MRDEARSALAQGLNAALPIWVGYAAVGVPFGVLAAKQGLTPLMIALMSAIVFAGSSQFIAVSMLGAGAGVFSIIITTFFVNLRHVLMSSALALHLKGRSKWLLSLYAYGVTDESFAVNLTRFTQGDWDIRRALFVNHSANLVWFVSTVAGGYLGAVIPEGALGIDYALTAMFLALLVLQITSWLIAAVALLSGVLAVLLSWLCPGNWHVIIATVIAATAGVVVQERFVCRRRNKERRS